ncbi:MAG: hypothetical protein GY838_09575 [bacterium]|nr:hypothetical protein [bacterium]
MTYAEVAEILGPPVEQSEVNGAVVWSWSFVRSNFLGVGSSSKFVSVAFRDHKVVNVVRSDDGIEFEELQIPSRSSGSRLPAQTVEVTNGLIEDIGGEYRYFFDIRNFSNREFNGVVKIVLDNNQPHTINGRETFRKLGVPPGLSRRVYIDAYTGPRTVHGDWSVVGYRYWVDLGGSKVVQSRGSVNRGVGLFNN